MTDLTTFQVDRETAELSKSIGSSFQPVAMGMCCLTGHDVNPPTQGKVSAQLLQTIENHSKALSNIILLPIKDWTNTLEREFDQLHADLKDIKDVMQQATKAVHDVESVNKVKMYKEAGRLIKHDIVSVVSSRASKIDAKIEKLDRRLVALHKTCDENLWREVLGRNIPQLVNDGFLELQGFESFNERQCQSFMCLAQLCNCLQLRVEEQKSLEVNLMQILVCHDIGSYVLKNFLQTLEHELNRKYLATKHDKWPKFAKKIKADARILLEEPLKESFQDIVLKLKGIGDMLKKHVKKGGSLQVLGNHVQDVLELFMVTCRKDWEKCNILAAPWGLLVLFWHLEGCFRHPIVEVDVCGRITRDGTHWNIFCGKDMSYEEIAVSEAKTQLNFVESVYKQVLTLAGIQGAECKVIKCFFMVHTTQGNVMRRVVEYDGDYVIVDVGKLQ